MTDSCGSDHHDHRHRDRRSAEPANSAEGGGAKAVAQPAGDEEAADGRRTATRAELLGIIAATCPHLPRTEVRNVFEAALDEMSDALRRGEAVKLRSFGQFTVRAKRERIGRNPRTGVEVSITPRRVLTFRPSAVLLARVNRVEVAAAAPEADEG